MKNYLIIIDISDKKFFEKISIFFIKNKLSSCVFLIKNIQSLYTYKKKICKENNFKILIKIKKKKIKKVIYFLDLYFNIKSNIFYVEV